MLGPQSAIPVLAFGTSITALGVVRLFGRAGVPCYLAGANGGPVTHSRWYHAARPIGPTVDPEVLQDYLAASGLERAVLVPCSDNWVTCVAGLPPSVRSRFPASTCSPGLIGQFVDKAAFARLLETHHVPHPLTMTRALEAEASALNKSELQRYFLKPTDSHRCTVVLGKKAFFSSTATEFQERLGQMREAGCDAVIQEYVPGPPASHYFVDGFVDRHGVPRAIFARRRLRLFPSDFGNSTAIVSISVDEVSEAVADLLRLFAAVEYRGIFSAEFKRDQRDGILKLLEVNTRPWWYIEFAALCGVNVCDLSYRDALELDVPTIHEYEIGRRYALASLELRALSQQLRRGEIAPSIWLTELSRAIKGGRPLDDPVPAAYSSGLLAKKALRRWTKRGSSCSPDT